MKIIFPIICLFFVGSLFAQEKDAGTLIPESTTRAVVIGISDYQDEKIPDLQFAHRDAQAFAAYLQSEAGEGLPLDHIRLLTNEQAKIGNIVRDISWLIDESKSGDRAIIYFSGHGDVENVTMFKDGYLLGYDTSPYSYMGGGTLSVYEFKRLIHTLSIAKEVQVLVILDACRSGKLAGSAYGGPKATSVALQELFANEVKIMSCQPDEFSWEGTEWGGGRGCFSYHLIEGLYGLADENTDLAVNLMEIRNYLEKTVPRETAPNSQIPMTVGNSKTHLAFVNETWLKDLKRRKAEEFTLLSAVGSKGLEDQVLANVDTLLQELYQEFLAALERGDLLEPAGRSADDYYRRLIKEPELEELHGTMRRNFAAMLQNEAQDITNKMLKTDPQVISDTWSRPFVFDHIPAYLARAAALLGEGHFYYARLKARQYYFEAKTYRKDNYPDMSPDSLVATAVAKMKEGLTFDSSAAYIYVDLGFLYFFKLNQLDPAKACAQKAAELSPNWVYAHYLAGNCYRFGPLSQAEFHLHKALELDSTFLLPYQELSIQYLINGENEKYAFYRDLYIQKVLALIKANPKGVPVYYRTLLGAELWRAGQYQEAEKVLLEAAELSNQQDLAVFQYLWEVYENTGRPEKALEMGKKQLEMAPSNINGYFCLVGSYRALNQLQKAIETLEDAVERFGITHLNSLSLFNLLGELYQETGQHEKAKEIFEHIIESFPEPLDPLLMNYVGRAYLGLGKNEDMQKTIDAAVEAAPDDSMVYYQAACLYSLAKEEKTALEWLEQAIQKGLGDYGFIQTDTDLDNIRNSEGFKALIEKYFPEQLKD